MKLNNIPYEIIIKIIYYLDDIDIKNFLFCDKYLHEFYNNFHLYKYLKYNSKNNRFKKEYYDMKIIDKNKYPYIKSYMFSNSLNIFEGTKYFFICKIYLDELSICNILPDTGSIKLYLGINNEKNIYPAKIIYKKNVKKSKKYIIYQRKYFIINKDYCLPFSNMRCSYIKNNLSTLLQNNDDVILNNEKFSNKYLFGHQTYYEEDPMKIISRKYKESEWILFATFDPEIIFPLNRVSKEMISFFISKNDLDKINDVNIKKIKINTFAIYNDIVEKDEE